MPLPAGISPRFYQVQHFHMIRDAFRENRAVLAEAPTGSGKSVLMALIVDSFAAMNKKFKLDRHLYFLVDEIFLMDQFSGHLNKWNIAHDKIGAGKREGRHVNVHVCTVQSLAKHPPKHDVAFFIIDEAHFSAADRFMNLFYSYPKAKILGLTASPEQSSGKGLAAIWKDGENIGPGIYDIMVEAPVSMKELTDGIDITDESGVTIRETYLVPIRYFGVPCQGIETLHLLAGDYKTKEVEKLLQERGTYGDAIREMQKFPHIKNHILFFCKSVAACYEMETILNSHECTAEVLEGSNTKKERRGIMKRFSSGETQILVTCRMVLKGVDLPFLLMAVDLAPTPSRGTLRQKIGRGTRKAEGKREFIYLDMVGNHRCLPNGDVYGKIDWNFGSTKYNKKPDPEAADNTCPICFALIPYGSRVCPECGAEKEYHKKKEKDVKHMDGDLVEIVPLKDRPEEEKEKMQGEIFAAVQAGDIRGLYDIAIKITSKRKAPYFVYHKLKSTEALVDVPLVYRISRELGYKPGWAYHFKENLKSPD